MDAVEKDLNRRKGEIFKEIELIFKANMKFTDWNVPEADDRKAGEIIIFIMREAIDKLEKDLKEGKYDNY